MSGGTEIVKIVLDPSRFVFHSRAQRGLLHGPRADRMAILPVEWGSSLLRLEWRSSIGCFDTISWDSVTLSGTYPGAALDPASEDRDRLLRVQVEAKQIGLLHCWESRTTLNRQSQRPPPPSTIKRFLRPQTSCHRLSHQRKLGRTRCPATLAGRATTVGRAARIIRNHCLSFDPISIKRQNLKDLAAILDRMGPHTKMGLRSRQVTFSTDRARCTFETSRNGAA